jgi:hypothetical protein
VKRRCKNSPTPSKDQLENHGLQRRRRGQAKGMRKIFNKIITENFPNLEKDIPIQMQEVSRTPNRPDQNRTTP